MLVVNGDCLGSTRIRPPYFRPPALDTEGTQESLSLRNCTGHKVDFITVHCTVDVTNILSHRHVMAREIGRCAQFLKHSTEWPPPNHLSVPKAVLGDVGTVAIAPQFLGQPLQLGVAVRIVSQA